MVKANRGSEGVDGQSLEGFAAQLDQQLDRLQRDLKDGLLASTGAASTDPEGGQAGRVSHAGNPDDL